jgi:hypothetical protein
MFRFVVSPIVILSLLAPPLASQRPLGHEAHDIWRAIEGERLSPDGNWLAYALTLQQGDAEIKVHALACDSVYTVSRGQGPRFLPDGRFVVFTIKPAFEAARAAKRATKEAEDLPKDSLGILELATGAVVRAAAVRSFPGAGGGSSLGRLPARANEAATGQHRQR